MLSAGSALWYLGQKTELESTSGVDLGHVGVDSQELDVFHPLFLGSEFAIDRSDKIQ